MDISRRNLLKSIAAGGGLLITAGAATAEASMPKTLPPEAVGLLYDATLCIGCKSCVVNCKLYNSVPNGALYTEGMTSPPYESIPDGQMWDAPRDLSGKTLNIIKAYRNGTAEHKDTPVNGYSFIKRQCMHCIAPACVSACPAGALRKDPTTGVVFYDEWRCIGCRYCQIACPYQIPRYEFFSATPQVRKCQLCNHRYKDGKYAACAEFCPTGATIFGKVVDLREEAQRRLAMKAGEKNSFPIRTLNSRDINHRPAAQYVNSVYGLKEAGGTQCMVLAGVPFDLLGFNKNITDIFLPDLTWQYISHIPHVIAGVLIGGTVTYFITHGKKDKDKEGKS